MLELDGTFNFTLPNDILVLPQEYVASDGAFETNSSNPGILFAPTTSGNEEDVPIIGRPFFSSAYIMVDLDAGTWTLWQANATADTRLVNVGEDCAGRHDVDTSTPTISSPGVVATNGIGSDKNDTTDVSANKVSTGMSGGAIAGTVVGAAVGLGVLAAALAIYLLRKKGQTKRSANETDIAFTSNGRNPEKLTPTWHEMPADSASELPAGRYLAHESPVAKRPIEAPAMAGDGQVVELPATPTRET